MSRVGKTPITLPDKVEVNKNGSSVKVSGPRGELEYTLPKGIDIAVEDGRLSVLCEGYEKDAEKKSAFGTARSLLENIVTGVSEGFKRTLLIQGVGYRAKIEGNNLSLNLGYSHPVEYEVPEDVQVSMPDNAQIVVEGNNKQVVGEVAAEIRACRPPDSYKGKGVRYADEEVILKEGKAIG